MKVITKQSAFIELLVRTSRFALFFKNPQRSGHVVLISEVMELTLRISSEHSKVSWLISQYGTVFA